jgi:hypothetical protein
MESQKGGILTTPTKGGQGILGSKSLTCNFRNNK